MSSNIMLYALHWDLEEQYFADFEGLAKNLKVNKSWMNTEGLVCFEYTQQAIYSLKKLYDFEIDLPEPPNEFSKEPLIFFLYQNSD